MLGACKRRRVELWTFHRSRDVGARSTTGAAQLARRVLQLVDRRQDGLLLARRGIEASQERVNHPAASPAEMRTAVPPPPRRVAVTAVTAVVVKSAIVASAYEHAHESDQT